MISTNKFTASVLLLHLKLISYCIDIIIYLALLNYSFYSFCARSPPAIGLFLSSHSVTPSQAQIFLKFSIIPAERAIIPQAML